MDSEHAGFQSQCQLYKKENRLRLVTFHGRPRAEDPTERPSPSQPRPHPSSQTFSRASSQLHSQLTTSLQLPGHGAAPPRRPLFLGDPRPLPAGPVVRKRAPGYSGRVVALALFNAVQRRRGGCSFPPSRTPGRRSRRMRSCTSRRARLPREDEARNRGTPCSAPQQRPLVRRRDVRVGAAASSGSRKGSITW